MRAKIPFVFIVVFLMFVSMFVSAFFAGGVKAEIEGPQELPRVLVIDIEGEIRAGTVQFVKRALTKAQADDFGLFLIQLNTPGGLLKATEEISRLLLDSKIRTAVFVHKSGGWAFSAGTFILLSAEIAVSHPNASIGAAQPRALGIGEAAEPDEKIIKASSGWMKSLAEARGRNSEVAEKFVRENLTLSGQEAHEQNIINFTAVSLDELLSKVGFQDAVLEEVKPNFLEQILSFLSISFLIPLLLGIGSLGLFFVFRTGEVEIGILAVIALLLGLWGMGAINLSALGTALLLFGIALIILEIFVMPGFGVFGIVGTIAFLFGILTFAQEPFLPSVFTNAAFWFVMGATLAVSVFFIVLGRLSLKTLRVKARAGPEALIGETAVVIEMLHPYGKVKINREDWVAKNISDKEVIEVGEKVWVVNIQGNTIIVKASKTSVL